MLYFEDFAPESRVKYGPCQLSEEALLSFAREFDPQPMHLDARSPQAQLVGGLLASGWQTCCLNMRMITDDFLTSSASMGSPGIEELKWLYPVRPGDRLFGERHVLAKRVSTSKPDRGFVTFRFDLINQSGTRVLEQTNTIMFARREPGAAAIPGQIKNREPGERLEAVDPALVPSLGMVQDLVPGTTYWVGNHTFDAHEIIRFAVQYDPQTFHLSEAGGKASHFGGLIASGWHTACIWLRTSVDAWKRRAAAHPDTPRLGPSHGFRDLQWIRPVYAGDTLAYYARIDEARLSASRPGWGLVTKRHYALNQKGDVVFAFTGTVMWEARHAAD